MTPRRWAAGLLCLSLLSYAGCTDDDSKADAEPTPSITMPTPSQSDSAATTESPTTEEPTPPDLPPAAEGAGDKAARAFARYWVKMINYAQNTGDTAPLEALHASYCTACTGGVKQVKADWARGKSLVGGEYTIREIKSIPATETVVHIVEIKARYAEQHRLNRAGKVVETTASGPAAFKVYLRNDPDGWVVGAFEVQQ